MKDTLNILKDGCWECIKIVASLRKEIVEKTRKLKKYEETIKQYKDAINLLPKEKGE